jgi:tetratricopeptide (TPR) repeat protein
MTSEGPHKVHASFKARACLFEEKSDTKKAEETYLEWIETAERSAEARYEYAAFLARHDKWKMAQTVAEKSIELDGESFKSQKLLGHIFEDQGDFKKAIRAYSHAYTMLSVQATNKESGALLCDRGNLHFQMNDIDKSIRDYKEGLKLFPKCHRAHWDLATILRDRKDFVGAQHHFDLALQSYDLTKKRGQKYIDFLLSPEFENQYDEMCQVAKFPCHMICGAVTLDLMFIHWSKLSPGLRFYVRNICTTVFNNISQLYATHSNQYQVAIDDQDLFPKIVSDAIVAFLMGEASNYE